MSLFGERERKEILKILETIKHPVKLINFTQTFECDTCHDTRVLLEELTGMSDKLSLEVLNFTVDKEKAAAYRIDKVPATVIEGDGNQRIRFYGVPAGYEFASLLEAIVLASQRDSGLGPDSRAALAAVREPLHLEVLVTPT
jgi:alkyl hydroperoxide reductase subunit AhpF